VSVDAAYHGAEPIGEPEDAPACWPDGVDLALVRDCRCRYCRELLARWRLQDRAVGPVAPGEDQATIEGVTA
jgi:hypothetical protein